MGRQHKLKTWPAYFEAQRHGAKNFEVRKHDRTFTIGDTLVLEEFDPATGSHTGRSLVRRVTYMLTGEEFVGVVDGFVVLGTKRLPKRLRAPPRAV